MGYNLDNKVEVPSMTEIEEIRTRVERVVHEASKDLPKPDIVTIEDEDLIKLQDKYPLQFEYQKGKLEGKTDRNSYLAAADKVLGTKPMGLPSLFKKTTRYKEFTREFYAIMQKKSGFKKYDPRRIGDLYQRLEKIIYDEETIPVYDKEGNQIDEKPKVDAHSKIQAIKLMLSYSDADVGQRIAMEKHADNDKAADLVSDVRNVIKGLSDKMAQTDKTINITPVLDIKAENH